MLELNSASVLAKKRPKGPGNDVSVLLQKAQDCLRLFLRKIRPPPDLTRAWVDSSTLASDHWPVFVELGL